MLIILRENTTSNSGIGFLIFVKGNNVGFGSLYYNFYPGNGGEIDVSRSNVYNPIVTFDNAVVSWYGNRAHFQSNESSRSYNYICL